MTGRVRSADIPGPSFPLILHEQGRQHYWRGRGPLSLKSFYGGRALYNIGPGSYGVDDHAYLLVNQDQEYEITIDSHAPVESFCVFFPAGFIEDVARNLEDGDETLLDSPPPTAKPVQFFERLYPHDEVLSPALFRLRKRWRIDGDAGWLEEQLHVLGDRLLKMHSRECLRSQNLKSVKAGTREELYRRLHRARDYAASLFDQPVRLEDLSRAACLSPNHLLRTFKQAFGQTPHQFLREVRLQRASEMLLADHDRAVTDVCLSVGFSSLGSFSWLFRQRFGHSPEQHRHQKR